MARTQGRSLDQVLTLERHFIIASVAISLLVHTRLEARVFVKTLPRLKPELKGGYIHPEEKYRVYILHVLRLLVWNFAGLEVPEGKVSIHDSVELLYLRATREDKRLLVLVKKQWEFPDNAFSGTAAS